MESDNHQVRTYVNGTLYSILTRPSLKDQALEMGMDEMLRRLMTHSDDEFKRQIEYILNQLKAENTREEEASDADEDDDEEEEDADDMEDEDDEPEEDDEETLPVAGDGDFEGESLLVKDYASKDGGNEAYVPEQKSSEHQHHQHHQQPAAATRGI